MWKEDWNKNIFVIQVSFFDEEYESLLSLPFQNATTLNIFDYFH